MTIKVQKEDFNLSNEINSIDNNKKEIGAVSSFIGKVRKHNNGNLVKSLYLQHYPGMTEKQLNSIELTARKKWEIEDCIIIHRYGKLYPNDQIVLVVISSKYRKEAISACSYIIDSLKTNVTFWKLEETNIGSFWLEQT
ncbi:molybdenum cofactor biosynthesis protein MoaE [Alphaproteobacteria bacterium]|nr:molybdenum cofactor biosynthesis protein MoaE [Alphaproteobacteria bacterium]